MKADAESEGHVTSKPANPDEISLSESESESASGASKIVKKRVPDAVFGGVQRPGEQPEEPLFDDTDEPLDEDAPAATAKRHSLEPEEEDPAHAGLGHRAREEAPAAAAETTRPKKKRSQKSTRGAKGMKGMKGAGGSRMPGKKRHEFSYDS